MRLHQLSCTGLVIGIMLFVYSDGAYAQHKHLNDSIDYYNEVGKTKKARLLLDKALKGADEKEKARSYYLLGETEETEGYSSAALNAYRKSKNSSVQLSLPIITAKALRGEASVLISLGQYDSVQYYLDESLRLDTSAENQLLNQLVTGRYWNSQNKYDQTLIAYQKALDHARALKNKKYIVMAMAGMAGVYFGQDKTMDRTRNVFEEANALIDSSRYANLLARNYGRLANVYMVMGKPDEAEKYLKRASVITDLSGNLPVRGYILSSLATLMAERGKFTEAIQYAEEPIRIKRELGQYRQLQNDLLNISEWYLILKQYDQARHSIHEGMATSTTLKDVVYLHYFYDRSARLDSITGDFKSAYTNLKKANIFKDSVFSLQRTKAVEEISRKYEAEQKEKVIAEKELVIQQQKYHQIVIIGTAAIIVLILVVILIVIRSRHSARLQSEKQKQDYLRLQTIVHTQEEVQQSIARDIHDGLVQVLGAAKMSLQAVNIDGDKKLIHHRIKEASQIMDQACNEARTISHQLLPYSLMKDGLVAALEELFAKSLANYHFNKSGDTSPIQEDICINIYRIAQELVNNIVKHAEAEQVNAEWVTGDEEWTLTISDNGKGFDVHSHPGVGLTNIQTRAELIGGVIKMDSQPGKGTWVQLAIAR
ncbi:MAG: hypothetical protein DI538_11105 [Azospira oryzae]|nr:MAG: hypothetical protein DI538_11105 [Azospira oryzae]